jgi:hypothetical protein
MFSQQKALSCVIQPEDKHVFYLYIKLENEERKRKKDKNIAFVLAISFKKK